VIRPLAAATALLASIVFANWVTARYGPVGVPGTGLTVLAGTYAAGFALAFRDLLHRYGVLRWVLPTIAVGAAVSFLVAPPQLAVASAVAFTAAELADSGVYAPLRERQWHLAVLASGLVGAVVDTALFLWIAPFPFTWPIFAGQVLVKAVYVTAAFLAAHAAIRFTIRRAVAA
jgi:queuosine precursor transporter